MGLSLGWSAVSLADAYVNGQVAIHAIDAIAATAPLVANSSSQSSSSGGGIQGRVLDGSGGPRRGVKISAKGYRWTTTTDADGYYTLILPANYGGSRMDIYVNGIFAVNCLVPQGAANSKVDVTMIRR